jgi:hypothetical protein
MGYNRAGNRAKQKVRRRKKEQRRLAAKPAPTRPAGSKTTGGVAAKVKPTAAAAVGGVMAGVKEGPKRATT